MRDLPEWQQILLLYVPALSCSVACLGLLFNVSQVKKSNRISRARLVSDLLHTFIDDEVMQTSFYRLEYGEFKYPDNFHKFHNTDEEKR
jgi:hypothetical protein